MRVVQAIATVGILFLIGCGGGTPPPSRPRPQMHAPPPVVMNPEVDALSALPVRYDPTDKRDPFQSYIKLSQMLDTEEVTAPLERFELNQLLVTAIIWGNEIPRALVQDPTGKEYIVDEGTPIGKNKGKITEIGDNLVLVKETYIDFRDRATTKEVEMRLYTTHGG